MTALCYGPMHRRANLNTGPIAAGCGCLLLLAVAIGLLMLALIPTLRVIFEGA